MSLGNLPFFKVGRALRDAELCALDLLRHEELRLSSFQFTYLFEAYCIHINSFWEILEKRPGLNQDLKDILQLFALQRHDPDSPLFYLKTARNQLIHEGPILHNSALDGGKNEYPGILFEGETTALPKGLYSTLTLPTFAMFAGVFLSLKPVTDHYSFKKLSKDVSVPLKDDGGFMNPTELVEVTYYLYGEMFREFMTVYRERE